MSLIVGSAAVGCATSPLIEGALYADEVFQDGVTFTSRYKTANAGQIQVVVDNNDSILVPKTPGSDFDRNAYANSVVNINCTNGFILEQDIPNFYVATLTPDIEADAVIEATKKIMEGRQGAGLACLVKEGTAATDTTALTTSNIKDKILDTRLELRKKFAKADVVIARSEVYNLMLKVAGTTYTPIYNDEVNREGRIGRWLGMTFVEANLIDKYDTLKYHDGTALQSVDMSAVDFLMYDHSAMSIIDVLAGMRTIDSPHFFGVEVQGELDAGFKVTRAAAVAVHSHS